VIFRTLRGFAPGLQRPEPAAAASNSPEFPSTRSVVDQVTGSPGNLGRGPVLFRRPLVSISTAMALIDVECEEQIDELIEQGKLRWAFDVSNTARRNREVRILGASINELLSGQPAPTCSAAEDFARAMDCIFPNLPATLSTPTIVKAWSVSSEHVLNLCRSNLLRTVNGSGWSRGPGGVARIVSASAIEFLKARRLT
jgi:hypothetical protein